MLWEIAFGFYGFSLNALLFLVEISSGAALAAFGEGPHLTVT